MDPNGMFFYNDNDSNNNNNHNNNNNQNHQNQNNQYYENNQNQEVEKPKKQKPKKNIFLILFFTLVLIGGFSVSGFIIVQEVFLKNKEEEPIAEPEPEPTPEPDPIDENIERDLTDQDAINRLNTFVSAVSYNDNNNKGIFNFFAQGVKEITPEAKVIIAYNSAIKVGHKQAPISEIPKKYERNISMSYLDEIPIETFYNEYRYLFNEELSYDITSLNSVWCPTFYIIDTELGKMYLTRDCPTKEGEKYVSKIYKYTVDNDYYYVYQYAGEVYSNSPSNIKYKAISSGAYLKVNSFVGNESKFETVIWIFDKNFNFVRTKNIGVAA